MIASTTSTPLSPQLVRAGQAQPLNVFGVTVSVLLDGAATRGAQSICHLVCPPGAGAPPHRHAAEDETFYVVAGRFSVRCGEVVQTLGPGDFVYFPRGVVHDFKNIGTTDGVMIGAGTPAGHEHFFRDADELARTGRFNPTTATEVCVKHGIELVAG